MKTLSLASTCAFLLIGLISGCSYTLQCGYVPTRKLSKSEANGIRVKVKVLDARMDPRLRDGLWNYTFQPPLADEVRDGLISVFQSYGYTVTEAGGQVSCEVTILSLTAAIAFPGSSYKFEFRTIVKQADNVLIDKKFATSSTTAYVWYALSSAIEDLVKDLDLATALRTPAAGKEYAALPMSLHAPAAPPVAAPPSAPTTRAPTSTAVPTPVVYSDNSSVAVVIGISDYVFLGKIPGCKADATSFANAICEARRMNPDHVILMTDGADDSHLPTKSLIEARISMCANEAKPDGLMLVYFSGHAVTEDGRAVLVPKDCRPADGIPLSRVVAWLDGSKARDKVLVVDACHAGAEQKGVLVVARESLPESVGVAMFLSCGKEENSYPLENGQRSVYTDAFLQCLKEAAPAGSAVTARLLEQRIEERMRDWRLRTGLQQTPQLILAEGQDMTLVPAGTGR